jgi:GTP cyclohydrolase I
MTLRGVRAQGTKTVTTALAGPLRADPQHRAEFLARTGAPS